MDPLSDVLRVIRLSGAFFFPVRAGAPWRADAPSTRTLGARVLPGAEHIMSYHIVTSGHCVGGIPEEGLEPLAPGDIIVFPYGDQHWVASGPEVRRGGLDPDVPDRPMQPVVVGNDRRTDATLVCGFFGCDRGPFNPLLAALPRQFVVRGRQEGWLNAFTRQVLAEAEHPSMGSATVLTRLAELMFIEVLREFVREAQSGGTGWLAGLADPVVARTLVALHADPARDWSLEALAVTVAASRTRLAERFRQVMGVPPMQYLAQWRMQVAGSLLAEGHTKVAAVAEEVGYDSEAAFSRAFKKATGIAPGAWRRRGDRRGAGSRELVPA